MNIISSTGGWQGGVITLGQGSLAVTALILILYAALVVTKRGSTSKYAFVAKYELRFFEYSAFFFALAIGLIFFGFLAMQFEGKQTFLLYFAGAVAFSLAFVVGYALEQYFRVYYPFFLEKKLRNIRFHPRKSPKGRSLVLLREHEEDAHMTKEMIQEEDAFTYDYDVWYDEESGYKKIEKYEGHLHAIVCPRCEFRTLKDYKEQVLEEPGTQTNGKLRKYYRCSYCNHEEIKDVEIASDAEEIEMVRDSELA